MKTLKRHQLQLCLLVELHIWMDAAKE